MAKGMDPHARVDLEAIRMSEDHPRGPDAREHLPLSYDPIPDGSTSVVCPPADDRDSGFQPGQAGDTWCHLSANFRRFKHRWKYFGREVEFLEELLGPSPIPHVKKQRLGRVRDFRCFFSR